MDNLKAGQSFSIYCEAIGLDLDGYTITSTMRSAKTDLSLSSSITDSSNGLFRLDGITSPSDSGTYLFDVKFQRGGIVDFSQTEKIIIEEPVTQ